MSSTEEQANTSEKSEVESTSLKGGAASEEHSHAGQPPQDDEVVVDMRSWRTVEVEIPADVVSKQMDATVQKYTKVARVPGFRKGKVPVSIIRNRFSDDVRAEVIETLVPQYFKQAVDKEGLKPISEPRLHDLKMEPGSPIQFKAAFEVMPDIELGNYKEIKVDLPKVEVTDEEVEKELKTLQQKQASYEPVDEDRPLRDGDFAQVSFRAMPKEIAQALAEAPAEPEQAEGKSEAAANADADLPPMEDVVVEIGGADTVPEFSANIRGAKPGEEKSFDISYADDFYEPRLAGQTLTYTAKINAIKKKSTPELNDEFARELGQNFETLDDLKKRIRESIEHERRHQADHEAREKFIDELIAKHDFPVPDSLVRRQVDFRLERGLRALAQQGMRPEDMKKLDFNRLRAAQRDAAVKEVKSNLLLDKIADAENIQITEEELGREIGYIAQQTNQKTEAVYQQYAKEGSLEHMREQMRMGKTMQLLMRRASGQIDNGTVEDERT